MVTNPVEDPYRFQVRVGFTFNKRIGDIFDSVAEYDVRSSLSSISFVKLALGIVRFHILWLKIVEFVVSGESHFIPELGTFACLCHFLHIDASVCILLRRDNVVRLRCSDKFDVFVDIFISKVWHPNPYHFTCRNLIRFDRDPVADLEFLRLYN